MLKKLCILHFYILLISAVSTSQTIDLLKNIQLIDFTDRSLMPPVLVKNITKADVYNTIYDNVDKNVVTLSDSIPLRYHSTYYYSPEGKISKIEIYSLDPGKENKVDTTIDYIYSPSSLILKFTTQRNSYTKEFKIEGNKIVRYNKDNLAIELYEFTENRIFHRLRYNRTFPDIPEEEWIINGNKIEYNKYVYHKSSFSEKAVFENGLYIKKENQIEGYQLIWQNNNEVIQKYNNGKTEVIQYYNTLNDLKQPIEEKVIYENGSGYIKRFTYQQ